MDRNNLKIGASIGIIAILVLSAFPTLIADTNISFDEAKAYTGPKVVFDIDIAKNNAGYIYSGIDHKINDNRGKSPKVDKWAVIIGISDYRGEENDLLYADDDAIDMYNYLLSRGYPRKNIKLLTNRKATANNIIRAIDWMNKQEKNTTSECVFFYSGHGFYYDGYDDGDPEYRDEGIVSSDLYLIFDGQLRERFSTFTSQKIAFIFDTCYSGGMDDLSGTGRVITTACEEEELSWETSDLQHGVFIYYFMERLLTHHNVEDAYYYAAPLAQEYMLNWNIEMDPQMYDQYEGDWNF